MPTDLSLWDRTATSLRFQNGLLSVLDQRLLPHEQIWHGCETSTDLIEHIHALSVRGAPLIGIAACLMLGQLALRGMANNVLNQELLALRASRPTAVNLMNYLDQMQQLLAEECSAEALMDAAIAIFDEDRRLCLRMAEHGLAIIPQGARVLTHCNTGSLATAGIGTALGLITHAHARARDISVWVDETRPLLQGGRLTAWELEQAQVPYHLICDSMAASLMQAGQVDLILVGADRIAANGDTANKVGTYGLAVLAKHHGVPFYVVAPQTTVDMQCPDAASIPIEQRSANEVRGVSTAQGALTWSPTTAAVYNPAFDVTPAKLISAWILDNGIWEDFSNYA